MLLWCIRVVCGGLGGERGVSAGSSEGQLDFFFGQIFGGEEGSAFFKRGRGDGGILEDWKEMD